MGYYLAFDDFYSQVKKEFSFLIKEGFFEKTFEKGRVYRYYYSNNSLTACVEYSITDNTIGIIFSRENDEDKSNRSKVENTLELAQYFVSKGYNIQFYWALMPEVVGFEASIKGISYLVEKFAIDLIREKEWTTNKAIMDGFRI